MKRSRSPKQFLHKHSLSLAALGVVVLLITLYCRPLDRWNNMEPAASHKEYVRWQRGPPTETSMELMKSWVDKTAAQDNIWQRRRRGSLLDNSFGRQP
jgi:hypothetical protein